MTPEPTSTPAAKAPRKRGRPRSPATEVSSVRLRIDVLDRYCREAVRTGQDVRTVMRQVLTRHAPKN